MWAGYLPPGKQTIYIYDRVHRKIWQKDVVIDPHPRREDSQMPLPMEYPHTERVLSKTELDKINKDFEDYMRENYPLQGNEAKDAAQVD